MANNRFNELEAFALLQSLGNYLRTNVETSCGAIERRTGNGVGGRETVQVDGHRIRVTVSNTAPTDPEWPAVVFTGVGLAVKSTKYGDRNFWGNHGTRRYENHLKVDLTNAPQGGGAPFPRSRHFRIDSESFPDITSDEREHGYYLFPGQSITYEISLSLNECPDPNELNFCVEGTVSRRHLFYYSKDLMSSSS